MTDQVDLLEQLGGAVERPPVPGTDGPDPNRYGRLAELAGWWRAVGGTDGGPRSPVTFWDPQDGTPPEDTEAAVAWGGTRLDAAADSGADLLLLVGADRIAGRILAAHLIDLDPVDATGFPGSTGLSDADWAAEVAALRDGLRRVNGLRGTPTPLLATLGSPWIAATVGALLRACTRRMPTMLDGGAAAASALLVRRVAPAARDWWQLAAGQDDPLTARVLKSLRLDPLTTLGIRAEDGTAGRIAVQLLRAAAQLPVPEPAPEPVLVWDGDEEPPMIWQPGTSGTDDD